MRLPELNDDRFDTEHGLQIAVQAPPEHLQEILDAVREVDSLQYGDYDAVSYCTAPGTQHFRSLGSGRNAKTRDTVQVECTVITFFVTGTDTHVADILKAIYWAHPYEEPVIFLTPCIRSLHVRGKDEDNPNRFWNRPTKDWVPEEHR